MEPKRTASQQRIYECCRYDCAYFLQNFAWIENATLQEWVRFDLWPAQRQALAAFDHARLTQVLKARQLGLTWLVLGYVLWQMLYHAITVALFFSRGETEAKELLTRIKGMYRRLPPWLVDSAPMIDNSQEWRLFSGSRAHSFPTTGGRSYTASIVVVDEADFIERFNEVMNAVKPTIDAGGQMILISTVDKSQPQSPFKQMYRAAAQGESTWTPIFLPWHTRPDRDADWYAEQKTDILARTGSLDDLHQEYPETPTQALAPRTLDKRILAPWIEACYVAAKDLTQATQKNAPTIDQMVIYRPPEESHDYVIGIDPAEGNPTSDDSALTVLDVMTGEECACLSGKFEPDIIAAHADTVGRYYNNAGVMPERNNHGHAVISWLKQNSRLRLLHGHDDKEGWLSSTLGKALLYNEMANAFRSGETQLHSFATYTQLASIEGKSLRAPAGQNDDRADSYALAQVGRAAMLTETTAMKQARIPGRGGEANIRRAVRREAA